MSEHTSPCGSRAIHLARAITEQEHRPLCEVIAEADASWRDECDRAEAKRRAAEEWATWTSGELVEAFGK